MDGRTDGLRRGIKTFSMTRVDPHLNSGRVFLLTIPMLCLFSGLFLLFMFSVCHTLWEISDSVVEFLPKDRGAAGSSLTGFTALWSLSKSHLS